MSGLAAMHAAPIAAGGIACAAFVIGCPFTMNDDYYIGDDGNFSPGKPATEEPDAGGRCTTCDDPCFECKEGQCILRAACTDASCKGRDCGE